MNRAGLNVRPLRPGSYEWEDRDDDVIGGLEAFGDHPNIVATFSLVRDNGMVAGIHVSKDQAEEIIAWLSRRLKAAA